MEVLKIVGLGITISIFVVILRQVKPELSVAVLIAGSVIMILTIVKYFTDVFDIFDLIVDKTGIDEGVLSAVLKIIGIGYLIEFSAGVCNDTGNNSIGDKVILGGKVLIFVVAMPIIANLLDIVVGLIP